MHACRGLHHPIKLSLLPVCLLWTLSISGQSSSSVTIDLAFIGDIMQHGPQIRSAYNPATDSYDYTNCFRHIAPSIRDADIAIANLELTLAGPPYSGYPTFSAPDALATALRHAGVDVLATANNHSLDRRKQGLERTADVLDSLNIPFTGTFKNPTEQEKHHPLMIHYKGVKIALLNYTYGTNGMPVTPPNIVNKIDTALIRRDLHRSKQLGADLIVAFMHWGDEYQPKPNKSQMQIARFCHDHGANMVIGSHPHVLQPVTVSKDRSQLTVYSLGNFVSNQRDRYRDGGMIFNASIAFDTLNHTYEIREASYLLTWVYKKRTPVDVSYNILPAVAHIDSDLIESQADREKLREFVADSRQHFQTHNRGPVREARHYIRHLKPYDIHGLYQTVYPILVIENRPIQKAQNLQHTSTSKTQPNSHSTFRKPSKKDSETFYSIQFFVSSSSLDTTQLTPAYFPNIMVEKDGVLSRYLTGRFPNEQQARAHLNKIKQHTAFKDAFIVKRKSDP